MAQFYITKHSSAGCASERHDTCSFRTIRLSLREKDFGVRQKLLQSAFSPEDTLLFHVKQLRPVKAQPSHVGVGLQRELHWKTDPPSFWVLFSCYERICTITIKKRNYNRVYVFVCYIFPRCYLRIRSGLKEDTKRKRYFFHEKCIIK